MSPMFMYQFPITIGLLAWLTHHVKPWRAKTGANSFVIWILLGVYSISAIAWVMSSSQMLRLDLSPQGNLWNIGLLTLAMLIPLAYRIIKSRDLTPNAPPPYPQFYKVLEELTAAIVGLVVAYALLWEMFASSVGKMIQPFFLVGVLLICHRFFYRFERRTVFILIVGIVSFFLLETLMLA